MGRSLALWTTALGVACAESPTHTGTAEVGTAPPPSPWHAAAPGVFRTAAARLGTVTLAASGVRIHHGTDDLALRTVVDGPRPGAPSHPTGCAPITPAEAPCRVGVAMAHPGITEWWTLADGAVQHGWVLHSPSAHPEVRLEVVLDAGYVHGVDADGRGASLTGTGGTRYRYAGLTAWDADGADVPAVLTGEGDRLWVEVDTRGARWPVTVDPTLSAELQLTASDGATSDDYGAALAGPGDLDGDGYHDLVVGAPGQADAHFYVVYGSASGLDPATEERIQPTDAVEDDQIGRSVAGAGDVDGDGYPEVAVGAPEDDDVATGAGAVFVYSGGAGGLDPATELKLLASDGAADDGFGAALAGGGDVDGDGFTDLAVGADGAGSKGAVYLFYGSVSGLDSSSAQRVESTTVASSSDYGTAIALGGDLDGDGYDDLVAGALNDDSAATNSGSAFVYYGTATGVDTAAEVRLAPSGLSRNDRFGTSVSTSGDLDGDGYDDLVVGAPQDGTIATGAGAAYVFFGSSSGLSATPTTTLRPADGEFLGYFGTDVAIVGDLDQDGFADLMVGAAGVDGDASNSGAVYLYAGSGSGPASTPVDRLEPEVGHSFSDFGATHSIAGLGATTASSALDVAVGSGADDTAANDAGAVFVYTGSCDADADGDGACALTDCDDTDPTIFPGAPDTEADGIDSDCDGVEICRIDADDDGYTVGARTQVSADGDCDDPGEALASAPDGDCDDTDAAAYPGGVEVDGDGIDGDCDGVEVCMADADADGHTDGTSTVLSPDADCTDPGEALASAPTGDCDDTDAAVFPGAPERIDDGVDSDCDGFEQCAADLDGDGFTDGGRVASLDLDCTDVGEALHTTPAGDCDDLDPARSPGGVEVPGDGVDGDCDGTEVCFVDADGDGVRTADTVASLDLDCWDVGEAPAGAPNADCDDGDAAVHPGAPEAAGDGVDSDCDGTELCFVDADGDGFLDGDMVQVSADVDCDDPGEGSAAAPSGDCDDSDPASHPGATEVPGDGIDTDCDGTEVCFADADGDGYADGTTQVPSGDTDCSDPGEAPATHPTGDCDDTDPWVHPGAVDVPNDGLDNDCDGEAVEHTDSGTPPIADADDGSDADKGGGCATMTSAGSPASAWLLLLGLLGVRRRLPTPHRLGSR